MLIRRISPQPREVHFSAELHDSLGKLTREMDVEEPEKALTAWQAVFRIRYCLVNGRPVVPYLSRRVNDSRTKDGLLWDYGMHHFHLSLKLEASGVVERSDYLLFAIVTEGDAYFVDVRAHQDPEKMLWVRQDLLEITHRNWPDLINSQVLRGVTGDCLTDNEKKELRRKNINHAPALGGKAIAPLGGGMTVAGNSILYTMWADRLVHELKRHESVLHSEAAALTAAFRDNGIQTPIQLRLVPLDNLRRSSEIADSLQVDNCLSRDLSRMGFAIVEQNTRLPVAISLEMQP